MGNYRDSPFVTGSGSSEEFGSSLHGLATEIFDYRAKEWYQADEYPYSTGDRFIVEYAILSMITPNNEISRNHASHGHMTFYNS